MAEDFLIWLLWLSPALAAVPAAKGLIHLFQLESYQFGGYFLSLKRRWKVELLPGLVLSAVSLALCIGADYFARMTGLWMLALGALLTGLAGLATGKLVHRRTKSLKHLSYTPRVKRLAASLGLLMLILAFALRRLVPVMGFSALLPLLNFLWLALAALIALPVEELIKALYQRDAVKMLNRQKGLIRIGITGSYGKTSVKFFLDTLLKQRFSVLATRGSFNTPMGVTRVIREDMQPDHRVMLAEMGARHRGDIKQLCRMVKPHVGILTAVGPQHLETFGTIERVRETKYDLIRSLPSDGFAVFYNDGAIVKELYDQTSSVDKVIVGGVGDDAWAEDVISGYEGSSFTLCFKDGTRIPCKTELIGEHNIGNVLLAAITARHLGLTDTQLKRGIASLEAVEARMKPEKQPDGSILINNAFNANPQSSRASLKLLSGFPGRKILVTPGYVELGAQEETFHRAFGENIAKVADKVLLIGARHTLPIREGLVGGGFEEESIHTFPNFTQARAYLDTICGEGDVILYENDLPDQYSEG